MTEIHISQLRIPQWTDADKTLIAGKIPRLFDNCSDPVGAKLYLALKSRQRLLEWRLGKYPKGLIDKVWLWRRFYQEAAPLLGVLPTWVRPGDLYKTISERVREVSTAEGHLSKPRDILIKGACPALKERLDWWIRFSEYAGKLRPLGGLLIVLGSQADGRTTPFSDIDVLIIGQHKHAEHINLKKAIEDMLLDIDPLQHHGVFFVEKSDLETYWQLQMPFETLMRAMTCDSDVVIQVRTVAEPYGSAATILSFVRVWESLMAGDSGIRGLWDWKYRLSQLMLIPTLLLAVGNLYVYKGDSFSMAKDLYSDIAWKTIEAATTVRDGWPTDYSRDAYLSQPERRFGQLKSDAAPVPARIAIWQDKHFRDNAKRFLKETRILANL
jgi:predicted nucleotidyltransferase